MSALSSFEFFLHEASSQGWSFLVAPCIQGELAYWDVEAFSPDYVGALEMGCGSFVCGSPSLHEALRAAMKKLRELN